MTRQSKESKLIVKLCVAAMMAALVFAGNYMRVKIPVSLGGTTAFTLANILCALSGLLLGPWWGGLAAGLGSAIFDMLDPEYIVEAPITFLTKGMYGLVAGLVLYLYLLVAVRGRLSKIAANISGGALVCAVAILLTNLGLGSQLSMVTVGSLVPLLPGVAFTNAIRDIADEDYISGAVRMLDVFLVVVCMAFGVGLVMTLWARLGGVLA